MTLPESQKGKHCSYLTFHGVCETFELNLTLGPDKSAFFKVENVLFGKIPKEEHTEYTLQNP